MLGAVLAVSGLTLGWVGSDLPWSGARSTTTIVTLPGPPPFVIEPAVTFEPVAAEPSEPPKPPRPDSAAGTPTRLVVPELGIDAPVVGIGVVDGVLLPPADPQTLGWWADGAVPGAVRGGALITGHTVHTGGGAMDHLETLRTGDAVRVRTVRGTIDYTVTGVTIYRKGRLARDAERVFSQSVPGRLVLITCEDWNGSGYDSNAIVFAERVA